MKLFKGTVILFCFLASYLPAQPQQDGSDMIRSQLATILQEKGYIAVAVMGFINADGRHSALGRYFSEVSIDYLANVKGVQLVERDQINQLKYEWDLNASGLISDDQVIGIGGMVGADVLVLGKLTKVGSRITVHMRAIDTRTGAIVTTGNGQLARSEYIKMYNQILE